MNTIRELIILQIMARLATITTTNGYSTNLGAHVYRVTRSLDPSDLPACVVYPQPETAQPTGYGSIDMTMPVRIEGLAEFGASNPSVIAEQMLGDIIKCLTSTSWDRRTLVTSPASPATYLDPYDSGIAYQSGGTDEYPHEEESTVGVQAQFDVAYQTLAGNPYAQ